MSFCARRLRTTTSIAFALALLAGRPASAAEEVWISPTSGNWSVGANWADGTAPAPGGDPALVLRFGDAGAAGYTAANDLGNPFVVGQLVLDNDSTGGITLSNATGNTLTLSGADPTVTLAGNGNATIGVLNLAPTSGTATIKGTGFGNLSIVNVRESGGSRALLVNAAAPTFYSQIITLGTEFTGGITLQSGNLELPYSVTTTPLIINGGTISLAAGVSSPVMLNSDLVIVGPTTGTASRFEGIISSLTPGAGVALRAAAGTLSIQSASIYTGATTIDYSPVATNASSPAGTLSLGEGSSILNSPVINIRAGGLLHLGTGFQDLPTNRIADTAAINLRGGELRFSGVSGSGMGTPRNETETVGAITGAGYSIVNASVATESLRLTAASLTRVERGTFLFSGNGLGGSPGAFTANIFFNEAPVGLIGGGGTGAQTSILPYAIGNGPFVGAGSFVTVDPVTGIRPLRDTDYTGTLGTATTTMNVLLRAGAIQQSSRTVNSLVLAGRLTGDGAITLTSGALALQSGAEINSPLAFGQTEANIFAVADAAITGPISGSGGLTKSGEGRLTLSGQNTFTGQLTINSGLVKFAAAPAFGADTGAIVINGHGAGLEFADSGAASLDRPIELGNGVARVRSSGALTLNGLIGGSGGLHFPQESTGSVQLSAGNTYTGPTLVRGGNVIINADSSFGAGGPVDLGSGGRLTLGGNWTTSRTLSVSSSATLDTDGFSAELNGPLTGAQPLIKDGAGTLRVPRQQPFAGQLTVAAGDVELSESGRLRSQNFTLSGGALILRNGAQVSSDRVDDFATVTLSGGNFALLGSAMSDVAESVGPLVRSASTLTGITTASTITLTTPSSARTQLIAASMSGNGRLLVRGDNLGGTAGGFTRLQLTVSPTMAFGLVPGTLADDSASGSGGSFAVYDTASDAAGVLGFRELRAAEYATGPTIQNAVNGGTTPGAAHFLAIGATTATGAGNSVASLTLDAASQSLGAAQTLQILSGSVLARTGLGPSSISGGTLQFGAQPAGFFVVGDLTLDTTIRGEGLVKSGAGVLTINGVASYSGVTSVLEGTLRPGLGSPLANQTVSVNADAILDLNGMSTTLGGLGGAGEVRLGAATLTVAVAAPTPNAAFSGRISGSGALVFVEGATVLSPRSLASANTFTGGTTLAGGVLLLSHPQALGTGALTINGGQLRTGAVTIANPVVLNADLVLGAANLTLGPGSSITGNRSIELRGAGALTIQIPAAHTGETRTRISLPGNAGSTPGDIVLGGALGSARSTSAFRLEAGGRLVLDDTVAFAGAAGGRVSDATPVHLLGSVLQLTGNATGATSETIGPLHGAGFSTVTVAANSGAGARLQAAELRRVQRGTFVFRGPNLGGAAGTGAASVFFDTLPEGMVGGGGSGTNRSILPYAVGNTSVTGDITTGLVTYEASTGMRLLYSGEYVTSLTAATPTSNVSTSSNLTSSTDRTINALALTENFQTLSGSGKLTVTSGMVLIRQRATISAALDFGSAEANFFISSTSIVPGASGVVSGVVTGSGGITKSGVGTLYLSGVNSFTGPLTINAGLVQINSAASLGPETSPITINASATGAGLEANGTSLTISRSLQVNGGLAHLSVPNAGIFTLSGGIAGSGGLRVSGLGIVASTGANTYTGPTVVEGGLAIASDAALGNTSAVILGGGGPTFERGLRLDGPWVTDRIVEARLFGKLDTNGQNATLNGPLTSTSGTSASLTKLGAGTLKITNGAAYTSQLTVSAGRLEIENVFGSSGGNITVSSGATLGGNGVTARSIVLAGTIDPGPLGGTGLLTVGGLSASNGATLKFDLRARDDTDALRVNGFVSFTMGLATLSLALGFDPLDGVDSFLLLDKSGFDPIPFSSRFSVAGRRLVEGDVFSSGGQEFRLSYSGGDGNDVVVHAIPEPSAGAFIALGVLALARRPRRPS